MSHLSVLARKISRAKWESADGLGADEIAGDAVTVDLRTKDNTLSFWTCTAPSEEQVMDVALALAAASERLDKIDIAWLNADAAEAEGLGMTKTDGETPVSSLRNRHVDIEHLDLVRLGKVAHLLVNALRANQYRRIVKKDVLALVTDAVRRGLVELDDLKKDMRDEVKRALG